MSTDNDRVKFLLQAASVANARVIAILDELPDAFAKGDDGVDLQGVLMDAAREASNAAFAITCSYLWSELGVDEEGSQLEEKSYREFLRSH